MKKSILLLVFYFLSTFMLNAQASGADLEIWPINQQISAAQSHSILWVKNSGTTKADIQIRIFKWSQAQGKDSLTAQQQVIALPPIIGILPGHQQPIRIINTAQLSGQQAYRIIIDEIPTAPAHKKSATDYGLQLRMRYVLPLFINGKTTVATQTTQSAAISQLSWQLSNKSGHSCLSIRNTAASYVRLSDVYFYNSVTGQKIVLSNGLMGYVLAHSKMHWDFNSSMPRLDHHWQLMAKLADNGKELIINR